MSEVQVKPSPEGVPGAVERPREPERPRSSPSPARGRSGWAATSPARRRPSRRAPSRHDRDPRGRGTGRSHPRHRQPLRRPRLRDAGGRSLHPRRRSPPPGDMEAVMKRLFAMSDADGARRPRRRRGLPARPRGGRRAGSAASASAWAGATRCCSPAREIASSAAVDCWGGFIDRATPDERSTPARPTPPLDLAERLGCPLLAAVGAEDHNPSPELGGGAPRARRGQRPGRSKWTSTRTPVMPSSPTTGRATERLPQRGCGGRSFRSWRRTWGSPSGSAGRARTAAGRACAGQPPELPAAAI